MSEFYDKFIEGLDPNDCHKWSKIRVGRELPPTILKGRSQKDAQFYLGNVTWAGEPDTPETLILKPIKMGGTGNQFLIES